MKHKSKNLTGKVIKRKGRTAKMASLKVSDHKKLLKILIQLEKIRIKAAEIISEIA